MGTFLVRDINTFPRWLMNPHIYVVSGIYSDVVYLQDYLFKSFVQMIRTNPSAAKIIFSGLDTTPDSGKHLACSMKPVSMIQNGRDLVVNHGIRCDAIHDNAFELESLLYLDATRFMTMHLTLTHCLILMRWNS